MIRALVLDDERTMLPREGVQVTHARHSWDAIALLRAYHYDEVWLDFDLGGDDKGSNVARFIRDGWAEQYDRISELPAFYIHSFNPSGRMSMQAILRDAGITAIMTGLDGFTIEESR